MSTNLEHCERKSKARERYKRWYAKNHATILKRVRVNRQKPEIKAQRKQYQDAHKEKFKPYFANRYLEQRTSILAQDKVKYQKNKEHILKRQKAYYQANKAVIAKRKKLYDETHKEEKKQRDKAYRNANRKKLAELNAAWRIANPERVKLSRERERANNKAQRNRQVQIRRAKLKTCAVDERGVDKFYRDTRKKKWVACYYCQALIRGKDAHIDHIIPIAKNGRHALDNLCTSCCDCNWSKNSKLPHEFNKLPQMFLTL
jgi:5-methylcytosine-specific restriction endonuclease McrA